LLKITINFYEYVKNNNQSKNTKLIDALPVEDEKEIDDEVVQMQLESFTSFSEEEGANSSLWKLQ